MEIYTPEDLSVIVQGTFRDDDVRLQSIVEQAYTETSLDQYITVTTLFPDVETEALGPEEIFYFEEGNLPFVLETRVADGEEPMYHITLPARPRTEEDYARAREITLFCMNLIKTNNQDKWLEYATSFFSHY